MLITRMTPKISVRPETRSASAPPVSRPPIATWMRTLVGGKLMGLIYGRRDGGRKGSPCSSGESSPSRAPSPPGLGPDRLALRPIRRPDDEKLGSAPLQEHEASLRPADGVKAQRADDRPVGPPVQLLDQLLVVDRLELLHRLLEDLTHGKRIRRVLLDVVRCTTEHLDVLGHELGVLVVLGPREPGHRSEHALRRPAQPFAERFGQGRPGGEERAARKSVRSAG